MRQSDTDGLNEIPTSLREAIKQDRLASAYLFYGRDPEGYTDTIVKLLKNMNCSVVPDRLSACGSCRDCIQSESLNHPDISSPGAPGHSGDLDPSNRIGVNSIREEIIEPAALTPARSDYKLFWIHDMTRLTAEASNTLLKVLEEPPGEALFLLTTQSRWDCLPTIRSRCQWIRIPRKPKTYESFFERTKAKFSGTFNDSELLDRWNDLLNGDALSQDFNWSRESARQFLEYVLLLINDHYTTDQFETSSDDDPRERLSYRLIPDILHRLDELERGGNPPLVVNSLLEEIFYPEGQDEWANVT